MPILLLLFYVLLLIGYHFWGYIGHFGYDDLHYAQLAIDFLNGKINFDDHFTYRFPVVVFTALSYSIFGINDFAASLPPLVFTVLILFLVYFSLKKENIIIQATGLSLTLFSGWFIFYSDKLMPDIYVAFSVVAALFIIAGYKFNSNKKHPALYSVLLSLVLLFGFMAKGVIVLFLPLLAYLFVSDILLKRDVKFWLYTVVSGLLGLSGYFALIWLLTGDVGKRFTAIAENSYLNECSYNEQPVNVLLERISTGFIEMLTFQGLFTGILLVFAFMFSTKAKSYLRFENQFSFFAISAAVLFLSSNFMTISLTSYSPMCLDPRHYLFLIPVAAIPAAKVVAQFFSRKKYALPLILLFAAATAWSFFLPGKTHFILYLPLFVLFATRLFLKNKTVTGKIFILVFNVVLLLTPTETVFYAQKIDFRRQKEILNDEILSKFKEGIVITDEVQSRLGNYYKNQFPDNKVDFVSFENFHPDSAFEKPVLLYLNWYTQYLSGLNADELPYFARKMHPDNALLFEDKKLQISIYKIGKFDKNSISGTVLLHSLNGFEAPVKNWDMNDNPITNSISYNENYANYATQTGEFSPTFSFPTDSLSTEEYKKLLIKCQVFCNYPAPSKSTLVISLENDEAGSYFWKGKQVDKQIKAYGNWWPVNFEVEINSQQIKKGSLLKIYMWNIDQKPVYIDDFEVTILGMEL